MAGRITLVLLAWAVLSVLVSSPVLAGNDRTMVLPNRPLALTRAQYQALLHVARRPDHAAISRIQATYRDKATDIALDAGQITFLSGLGGGIITVLICAAPL